MTVIAPTTDELAEALRDAHEFISRMMLGFSDKFSLVEGKSAPLISALGKKRKRYGDLLARHDHFKRAGRPS